MLSKYANLYRYGEVVKRDARHTWVYNLVKLPLASARDYTIKIESKPAKSNNQPHLSSWTIDNAPGPPAKRGMIRLVQNKGSWELKVAAGGAGTAVRYRLLTDPGAALPA